MLEEIRIAGLGVIEDAVLELDSGLTVVTGETGAGKTMVVQGLALLFGARAEAALVRPGRPRAVVEGRLVVPADGPTARRAADAGAELDDGALIVSRSISAEGRSRAYVGGRTVPVGVLAELAEDLVAVHGQSDQYQLVRPMAQRRALDRFAGDSVEVPLAEYRGAYAGHRELLAAVADGQGRARERAQQAELLRAALREVAEVDPQAGEDRELAIEVARLAGAHGLRAAAVSAHQMLAGDPTAGDGAPDATSLLASARRAVDAASADDPRLAQLGARLAELGYLLADLSVDLSSYAESIDADPARLAAGQDRQAALARLLRNHRARAAAAGDRDEADVDGVLRWTWEAANRLAELDRHDERIAALVEERDGEQARLTRLAAEISAARHAAAAWFAEAVGVELAALALPRARVEVVVSPRPALGPDGADDVELVLCPHPGAPGRPLGRGASGGELARVMLAIEVVFAGADPVPTMVFDEVDAGVGGRAAVEVGRRLARLARRHQVIVVTHLPQVAAYADRHLLVVKADDGTVIRTGVRTLDDAGRVGELSRMLAGQESALARGHARELLAAAASAKSQIPT